MYNTSRGKIIPFPSVSFNIANDAQFENMLNNFLNELGYTENKEVPDRFQMLLDDFLREMGYIE